MTDHQLLDELKHRDLRVHTGHGAEYGDNVMSTLAIPSEFRDLVADYPVFLHRDEDTGRFLPMVMFGFENGENLFLEGNRWNATYVPLMIQRGPFLIGFQRGEAGLHSEQEMMLSIDMDNPRVGSEGEPVFQPFGGVSEYTEQIVGILQRIDLGQSAIEDFAHALEQHDLIEPLTLEIKLDSGKSHRLVGFHTIHEEKLAELDAGVLADFCRRGILHGAYMLLASLANIPRLIQLRNRREGSHPTNESAPDAGD